MNEERVLGEVSLHKDVDGFHPLNIGKLAMHGRDPLFVPCTPKGCIELLLRSGIQMAGKHAVVIGRSNIVGIPAAMLLQVRTVVDLKVLQASGMPICAGSLQKHTSNFRLHCLAEAQHDGHGGTREDQKP